MQTILILVGVNATFPKFSRQIASSAFGMGIAISYYIRDQVAD
jgi:hypothetical protein